MKYTLSNTTKAAIRKKTTASETAQYQIDAKPEPLIYLYVKKDKSSKDDDDRILVSAKGLRFVRHTLEEVAEKAAEQQEPTPQSFALNTDTLPAKFDTSFRDGQIALVSKGNNFKIRLRDTGSRYLHATYANGNFQFGISGAGNYLAIWDDKAKTQLGLTGNDIIRIDFSGFDLALTINGKVIYKDKHYDHVLSGAVVVEEGIIGEAVVTVLPEIRLLSDIANNEIDVSDFDARASVHTTGSVDANNLNRIKCRDVSQFRTGDIICIETGGAKDFNGRKAGSPGGSKEVGKPFPSLSYESAAAMQADKSKPDKQWASNDEDGLISVYDKASNKWIPNTFWYVKHARAGMHRARVIAISGDVLLIDEACYLPTTDADIVLDSFFLLSRFMRFRPGIDENQFPAKKVLLTGDVYNVSERLTIGGKTGWQFIGKGDGRGKESTVFRSPKGGRIFFCDIKQSPYSVVSDLIIEGNGFDDQWGVDNYATQFDNLANSPINDLTPNYLLNIWWSGFRFSTGSDYAQITRVKFRNTLAGNVFAEQAKFTRCWDCSTELENEFHEYIVWNYGAADGATDMIVEDINYNSKYMTGAGEAFGSGNAIFRKWKVRNGRFSANSSDGNQFRDIDVTVGANCKGVWDTGSQPIINENNNARKDHKLKGDIIDNIKIHFEDYIDDKQGLYRGILVNDDNEDIKISRVKLTAEPGIVGKGIDNGVGAMIVSTGKNTQVEDCESLLEIESDYHGLYQSNIGIKSGRLNNNRVKYLYADKGVTLENNTYQELRQE